MNQFRKVHIDGGSHDGVRFCYDKLRCETDPSDVHADLGKNIDDFIVIDVRSVQNYTECHIPGALNFPTRSITPETTEQLSKSKVVIVYCWGPGCNGSTKAALRFSELGFKVKEMIGGIEYWRREGFAVEGTLGDAAPLVG